MKPAGRKISAGTYIMLIMTLLIVIGSTMVMFRLFSGNSFDLNRPRKEQNSLSGKAGSAGAESASSFGSDGSESKRERSSQIYYTSDEGNGSAPVNAGGRFSLSIAGTAAMEGDIRKSGYISEVKKYDLSDTMLLLKNELQSDINIVFFENLLMDNGKPTDIVAPSAAADMLRDAGFNMAACGFHGAWNQKETGISETRKHLQDAGIAPVGIYNPGEPDPIQVINYGGIPTVILQYTDTISQKDRKNKSNANLAAAVPAANPDEIAADIETARIKGADLVIILMNWGTRGNKEPNRNQRILAQEIADAGADIIIGSGSRIPQTAEYLTARRKDGSEANVLCVWSLGVTLSKDRSSAAKLAGYLFTAEFVMDSSREVRISETSFTPLYTWRYVQEKRESYRCVAANRTPPGGMDIKQQNSMNKAADYTRETLKDSPLMER